MSLYPDAMTGVMVEYVLTIFVLFLLFTVFMAMAGSAFEDYNRSGSCLRDKDGKLFVKALGSFIIAVVMIALLVLSVNKHDMKLGNRCVEVLKQNPTVLFEVKRIKDDMNNLKKKVIIERIETKYSSEKNEK